MTRFLRYLYSALFYLLIPIILLRLLVKSYRNPAYRQGIFQRFAIFNVRLEQTIWVHAVSVGESLVAIALIKELEVLYPAIPIVVTTMTPTGAERIRAALGGRVQQFYVPYDLPDVAARFLTRLKPMMAIIVETELWPNLFHACKIHNIPMVLANARLSPASFRGYQRITGVVKEMLSALSLVLAQSALDAKRFVTLGMDPQKVVVAGNIKFDLALPEGLAAKAAVLRKILGEKRPIWIAASTHAGEETQILDAHQKILADDPSALLVLVPRHPERFSQVAEMVKRKGFALTRRSSGEVVSLEKAVYLGDSMGEMMLFYAIADLAFVGGSWAPVGGHNLLEPAALAKPVLSGPKLFNFTEISQWLKEAAALTIVEDAETLAARVIYLLHHEEECFAQGLRGQRVVWARQGALKMHRDSILRLMPASLQNAILSS